MPLRERRVVLLALQRPDLAVLGLIAAGFLALGTWRFSKIQV